MIFERVSRSTYPPQNGKLRKYIKLILTTFIYNLDVFYQLVVSFIHSGLIFEAWIFAQASRRLVQISSGLFAHPTKLLQISTISCLSFHHVAHNLIPPYLTIFQVSFLTQLYIYIDFACIVFMSSLPSSKSFTSSTYLM